METRMKKLVFASIFAFVGASTLSSSAFADTAWEKNHPRRDQVNDRLAHQNKRIKAEVREGDLSKQQAAALHKDDRQIRKEERLMAAQDHGHITRADQRALNQQENTVSRQIGH
jgi:pectin methylesterase-like acyl-CoA thioesterase